MRLYIGFNQNVIVSTNVILNLNFLQWLQTHRGQFVKKHNGPQIGYFSKVKICTNTTLSLTVIVREIQ